MQDKIASSPIQAVVVWDITQVKRPSTTWGQTASGLVTLANYATLLTPQGLLNHAIMGENSAFSMVNRFTSNANNFYAAENQHQAGMMVGMDVASFVGGGASLVKGSVKLASSAVDAGADLIRGFRQSSLNKINMRSADDLLGVEPASSELISAVMRKRDVVIAKPGSEELRMLDFFWC